MAAHRYWRLQIKSINGGATVGLGELQMRTSLGGTNVATGGTASASTIQGTYTAAKAFDGLTTDTGAGNGWLGLAANFAGSGSDGPGSWPWLKYDFGSGNDKDIQEIVIFCPGTGGLAPTSLPTSWFFQWSDDNVLWTNQRAYTFDSSTANWTASSSRVYDVRPFPPIDVNNYTVMERVGAITNRPVGDPMNPGTVFPANVDPVEIFQQSYRAGVYKLMGTTTVLGYPAPRRVRLYTQDGGRLYAEQYTTADGLFEFRNLDIGPWTVVGVDDTGTQNGVIYSHVNAVPM